MRTLEWDKDHNQLKLIDQRKLPAELVYQYIKTSGELITAIQNMIIRGAPALGVAGAFGIALEARNLAQKKSPHWLKDLREAALSISNARPTAVNLTWGVNRVMKLITLQCENDIDLAVSLALSEALAMAEEDVATNQKLAINGASLINDGDIIIHHCNTGALAGVDWGTALGAIRYAHESGKKVKVLVDETRPRLQGSRLTAWECEQYGIPYEVITDNAAGYFLQRGLVNAVFFGADRVAANGDVVNKIGTYMLSLAAHANNVPVISVFPKSTVDLSVTTGLEIPIEERDEEEVLGIEFNGQRVSPKGTHARNPAFDVTPNSLITAWVTEDGVLYPPFNFNYVHSVYNSK